MRSQVPGNARVARYCLRIMLLVASLSACDTTFPQASRPSLDLVYYKTVDLPGGNMSLQSLFDAIRKDTRLRFYYRPGTLNSRQKIRVPAGKILLLQLLDLIVAGKGLEYSRVGSTICIHRKEMTPPSPIDNDRRTATRFAVTDDHDAELPGAILKNLRTGETINTDENGTAVIHTSQLPDTIRCYAPNREPDTIILAAPTGKDIVRIKMRPKDMLNEAVVTGYATGTRRTYTGDRTLVDHRQIEDQPVSDLMETLTGRVPGLLVTQTSGVHGASMYVSLRGRTSILNGQDPLYIIDGVPFAPGNQSVSNIVSGNAAGSLNPFSFIPKEDVETIEVLKDADATAIYGSKGANGVIIITTRHGAPARHLLDLGITTGIRQGTRRPTLMNMREYTAMRIGALKNDGFAVDTLHAPELLRWDTTRSTDWGKWLIGGLGHTTNLRLSLTGGSDAANYFVGFNQLHETDVYPTKPAHDLLSFTGNVNLRSGDGRLNIRANALLGLDNNHQFITDLTRLQLLVPNAPALEDKNGRPVFSSAGLSLANPLSFMNNPYTARSVNNLSDIDATYQLNRYFSCKVNLGYNSVQTDEHSEIPVWTQDVASGAAGSRYTATTGFSSWIVEPQLEYRRRIGKWNISWLAGSTWQGQRSTVNTLSAIGYHSDADLSNPALADSQTTTAQTTDYLYRAFFSRLNLRWKEQIILNLTARRDGSTRFGPGKQYGNFGAGGFAWIFSDQPFSRRIFPFLSFGKLRTSYGITGNDLVGGGLRYFNTWAPTATTSFQNIPGTTSIGKINPEITWESITKLEFAMDLGLLHNRIFLTAAWYRHRSNNQLLPDSFPNIGAPITLRNRPVVVQNSGWEFTLTAKNIDHRYFGWTTSVNASIPVNKLLSFPGLAGTPFGKDLVVGQSLTSLRAYRYTGIDPLTGVYTFKDKDSNNRMTDNDREIVGRLGPTWFGGIENSFRWHRWRLSMLVEARVQTGINYQAAFYANNQPGSISSGLYSNETTDMLNRWNGPGSGGMYQRLTTRTMNAAGRAINSYLGSSALLTDASFARLKSVSLSCQLPSPLLRKMALKDGRLLLQAENLFTWTPYKSVDPELQNILVLPPVKIVSLTIQARF